MQSIDRIIELCQSEVEFDLVRASGPGGQNVNKVATAVQLRFDAQGSSHLDHASKHRLRRKAGRRLSPTGVLVIRASRYRTQAENREDARARFAELLRESLVPPKKRLATKATAASRERRLRSKKKKAEIKRMRSRVAD